MARSHAESQTRSGVSSRGRSTKPRRYTGTGDSDDEVSEGTNKRRKHHNPWSVRPSCPPSASSCGFAMLGRLGTLASVLLWSNCKLCDRRLGRCSMALKGSEPREQP